MRLISCHIENFGAFSNTDIDFDPQINVKCWQNGRGKTTLAAFLKAMFYGMESDRSNSLFNDRRRYFPFGGGNYGGYVVFSAEGKTYKIERYFADKSDNKDELTVYCNGIPVGDFPKNPGEKFFGIDKKSFELTAFISGGDVEISSTDSINSKLNAILLGGADSANYALAQDVLEKKSKEYKKNSKGTDKISVTLARINNLSAQIENKRTIAAGLPQKYERLNMLQRRADELASDLNEATAGNLLFNNWEHYDALVAEAGKTEGQIASILAKYPNGVPAIEEAEAVTAAIAHDKELRASGERKAFTEADQRRHEELCKKFSNGVPQDGELAAAEEKIRLVTSLGYEIDRLGSKAPAPAEEELSKKFGGALPPAADQILADAEKFRAAEEEYNSLPDQIFAKGAKEESHSRSVKFLVAVALCVLLLIGSIVCFIYQPFAGGVLLAVGVIGLIATGFLYLNKKASAKQQHGDENPQKAHAKAVKEELYVRIRAALAPYGYSLENGVAYAVAAFGQDVKLYSDILASRENARAELSQTVSRKAALEEELNGFFGGYCAEGQTYMGKLSGLRSDINSYNELSRRKAAAISEEQALADRMRKNMQPVSAFCQKYGLDGANSPASVNAVYNDILALQNLQNSAARQRERAAAFKAEKGLGERPSGAAADTQKINSELAQVQRDLIKINDEILTDEREADELGDLVNSKTVLKEKLDRYRQTYDILCKTLASMQQANRNLQDKYVKPIKDRFTDYSDALERALGEKITMNAKFELRFVAGGRERDEKHLSSGQRSICALCFRLALIDNMYSGEKPFVVMDDPFAGMDQEHMERVKLLLSELSQRIQIIYLTCHPSRAL